MTSGIEPDNTQPDLCLVIFFLFSQGFRLFISINLAALIIDPDGCFILVFILFVIIHLHFAVSIEPPLLLDPSAKLGSVLVQYADQAELEWIFTWP